MPRLTMQFKPVKTEATRVTKWRWLADHKALSNRSVRYPFLHSHCVLTWSEHIEKTNHALKSGCKCICFKLCCTVPVPLAAWGRMSIPSGAPCLRTSSMDHDCSLQWALVLSCSSLEPVQKRPKLDKPQARRIWATHVLVCMRIPSRMQGRLPLQAQA